MEKQMPSGTRKEQVIKRNLELCIHRANVDYMKKHRVGEPSKQIKEIHEKEYIKAAHEADRISKR